jgi:hypothetical protein
MISLPHPCLHRYGREGLMTKHLSFVLVALVGSFVAWLLASDVGAQPPSVQRIADGCALSQMPATLREAVPTQARPGYRWVSSHYRCTSGQWEFVPGHWRRTRAQIDATAVVEYRDGRLFAKPDYRFVQQPDGAVTMARIGGGGLGNQAVKGKFRCRCACQTVGCKQGGCSATIGPTYLICENNGCGGSCGLVVTIGSAGVRSIARLRSDAIPCDPPNPTGTSVAGGLQSRSRLYAHRMRGENRPR